MDYEAVMGLEVHAQLSTQSKIFCGCSTRFGAAPNSHVCPVCMGMPGVLPVLNEKVVEYAMRMALATGCAINRQSRFARKNYFYPDLPKAYQISQYEQPLAEHGGVTVDAGHGPRTIRILRIHMEEDAGKLTHDPGRPVSRVDFNRTGVPLIEIVSEPDIRTPAEAAAYLRELHSILRFLDICDGNMEEGSFRCDANVSVRPRGQEKLGTRAELKNMNSFRNVERALEYEIERQIAVLTDGGEVVQETRLWDADAGRSCAMRGKEEAHDYRYFPDPDLLPLVIQDAWIERVRRDLPKLAREKKARYMKEMGLSDVEASELVSSPEIAEYFENAKKSYKAAKTSSADDEYVVTKPLYNWITSNVQASVNATGIPIDQLPVTPDRLAALLSLQDQGVISGKIAKTVFDLMLIDPRTPADIVKHKGLTQVSDSGEIEAVVDEVLAANPKEVEGFRGGKTKLMGFFVGEVMKKTRGKANPQTVNQLLKEKLGTA